MKALFVAVILLVAALGPERIATAEEAGTTFALIVTNNRSMRLSRPELRYADDDGAKYYEVFRMIAPEANVALLTTFDRDTEKLFPDLVSKAKTPSKADLLAVGHDFAQRVAAAKQKGPVDFYFIFAGHGDIDNGKGFLELSDGPFTSDDLETLLREIPATRSHVILDSCNSFFVINARKPGGRHFVTSEEATRNLSERLPNVGVFLSTSAEAEVYEWSELQSGVFSHAVRSGLLGAADENGDGRVSYDELRAFVNTASNNIKNPLYRPQVFARGPSSHGSDAILNLAGAEAVRIRVDEAEHRLTVRDEDDLPWVDAHKEAGAPLTLYLPPRAALHASVEEKNLTSRAPLRRYALPSSAPSESLLASLPASETTAPSIDSRGPDEMFSALFARPFGPRAFAQYQSEARAAPPVTFGIAEDDKRRMRDVLRQGADRRRIERYTNGFVLTGVGALLGGVTAWSYTQSGWWFPKAVSIGGMAAGGGVAIAGIVKAVVPSREEAIYRNYVDGMARSDDAGLALRTEEEIFTLAVRERKNRTGWRWVDFGLGVGFLAEEVVSIAQTGSAPQSGVISEVLYGAGVIGFGSLFGLSFIKSPAEQMRDLWVEDPSLLRLPRPQPSFTIQPQVGLGSLGFSGTF